MKTKHKNNIIFIGLGSLLAVFMTFSWTFFHAYFSPTKQILVNINIYGEANIEFVILLLMIIIVPMSLFFIFKRITEKDIKEKTQ